MLGGQSIGNFSKKSFIAGVWISVRFCSREILYSDVLGIYCDILFRLQRLCQVHQLSVELGCKTIARSAFLFTAIKSQDFFLWKVHQPKSRSSKSKKQKQAIVVSRIFTFAASRSILFQKSRKTILQSRQPGSASFTAASKKLTEDQSKRIAGTSTGSFIKVFLANRSRNKILKSLYVWMKL